MTDFQFEEENSNFRGASGLMRQDSNTFFMRLLIKLGLAKNAEQAQMVLIGILAGVIVVTIIIFIVFVGNAAHDPVPSSEIYQYRI